MSAPSFAADMNGGEKYVYGNGANAFVLKLNPAHFTPTVAAHLQFSGKSGITALYKKLGVRGDVIYVDENGKAVLRESLAGGITLYHKQNTKGVPVSRARDNMVLPSPNLASDTIEGWSRAYEYSGEKTKIPAS